MIKRGFVILLLACFFCLPFGQSQLQAEDVLPPWLDKVVRDGQIKTITQYYYKGQVVYFAPEPDNCDDCTSSVYNANGTLICSPDGGFTGIGDGKCPDFLAKRSDEKIIWRRGR